MKRIMAILILLAFSQVAHAQAPKPNMFPTAAACKQALESGNFQFYQPKYFDRHDRNPVNERDRVLVPIETDLCVEMWTVHGRQFVVQQAGTMFRARKLTDGSLSFYARNDCGNTVYSVVQRDVPIPVSAPVPPPLPPTPRQAVTPPPPQPVPVSPSGYVLTEHKGGCGTKCKLLIAALVGGGGYAAYYYWPCPPGTIRR